ncbi:MAG TPA: GTP 3',8-cyclase MoaA, partial [Pseudomonadales bacterium]|nr:GTP 3',8-cyclase MoaA [Pseudomonadales bacterium]
NDIIALVEYARSHNLNISFIEEMPLGHISSHERNMTSLSNAKVRDLVNQHWPLTPTTESTGGPARYYRMPNSETRVGFISPHTHNFCDSCNRVRVTAEGKLVLCLGHENAIDLKPYLHDAAALQETLIKAMALKPERHQFDLNETKIVRFMNMTGG